MAELPTGDKLASIESDFQAAAEVYYSIAVERVKDVVLVLPDDIRPGPDLYGVPWEPVIITSLVGLVTILVYSCRFYSSVKSRMYQGKERRVAKQIADLLNEKCNVLEAVSQVQTEYDELESVLRDSGVLAQTEKAEKLELKFGQLECSNKDLENDLKVLKEQLEIHREHHVQQERTPSDEQQKEILCRVCGATVLAKSGNTTNLFYHLKAKHAIEYQECQAMQPKPSSSRKNAGQKQQELIQSSIQQSFSKGTPYNRKQPAID
ncbi:cTAGE family member 6 [Merluccius polli]|uniref:CTAGE family member 6 n=1 Tax=Merluccius polli TaxID=89951 RepID=A0AA47N5D1_MERPO|nr:cTAGE family member 6 [Merluccius polli]